MSHLPIPPLNILTESSNANKYLLPLFDQATSSFWYIGWWVLILIVAHPILDIPFNLSSGQNIRINILVSVNALMYLEIIKCYYQVYKPTMSCIINVLQWNIVDNLT